VLVEQALVDPERAGVHRADGQGGQLPVLVGEPADTRRGDLGLPVLAQRLGDDRGHVLGEGPVLGDVGARLHVEDVRPALGSQRWGQCRLPVRDRDQLEVDLDVGIFLVERGDVAVRGRRVRGRPAPPVDGARRRWPRALFLARRLALFGAFAAAAYRAAARAEGQREAGQTHYGK
jgi:hypothetical protein